MIVKYNYSAEVDSTSIEAVYYDSVNRYLAIKFVNGNWAGYMNVPGYIYTTLISADSVGSYYNRIIRGNYSGFKVDDVQPAHALVPKPEPKSAPAFKVVAEITGEVTLTLNANDLTDALKVAQEQITKALGNSVKISFKGVNVV